MSHIVVIALLAMLGAPTAAAQTSTTTTATIATAVARDHSAAIESLQQETRRLAALMEEVRALQEELLLGGDSQESELSQPALDFYGFIETGAQRTWTDQDGLLSGLQQTPAWSFILGNIHLYLDAKPARQWRALVELRVTTSHGALSGSSGGLTILDTSEPGINEPGLGNRGLQTASSVVLERAQVEWQYNDQLGLRLGLWLTPWGIWNVDHGSPALIPLLRPFQSFQVYPTHQIGLALFGALHLGSWQLSYNLGLSNGRLNGPSTIQGPRWSSFDVADDKMVSGRVTLSHPSQSELAIGLSAYWGTTAEDDRMVTAVSPVRVTNQIGIELEEWGVGADLSWNPWELKIRAEFLYNQYRYPGERPGSIVFPLGALADSVQWGGYVLVAAPLDWDGLVIEPYLYGELLWMPIAIAPQDLSSLSSIGVNIHASSTVKIKLQYAWLSLLDIDYGDGARTASERAHLLSSRVVVSF